MASRRTTQGSRRSALRHLLLGISLVAVGLVGCSDDDPIAPQGEPEPTVDETVELILTARSLDDQPIAADGSGVVNVTVGQEFDIEVSYVDHRDAVDRLGAAGLFLGLLTSESDVLRPVLSETFGIVVGEEIRTGGPAGILTFALEGSGSSYESSGPDFVADPRAELILALAEFGYSVGEDFELEDFGSPGGDIRYYIRWDIDGYGNVDMPDPLIVASGFTSSVPTQAMEFAPVGPDGVTPNSSAVRFNVDARSRSLAQNAPFYVDGRMGEFDAIDGFTGVGGQGPDVDGGVPEAEGIAEVPRPFDAFSLRVQLVAPVTGFSVSAVPGEIFMYGLEGAVAPGDIRTDGDHVLTFNTSGTP